MNIYWRSERQKSTNYNNKQIVHKMWHIKHFRLFILLLLSGHEQRQKDVFEWVHDCCLTLNEQFFSYIMARTRYIWWEENNVSFVLDQHALLDCYSGSLLKQQSVGRHVAPLGHINLFQANQYQSVGRHVAPLGHINLFQANKYLL